MANVILTASPCQNCGGGGGGGECGPGEECLPSDFVAPCEPGSECLPSDFVTPCEEGTECLPSDFIDPGDCPAGCDPLDPSTIDGLVQWYDADDAGTFTFTSGIEVDTWADKSGNGNDLETVNAFGGNPSRVAGAVNGRAAVYSGIEFAVDSGSMAASVTLDAPFQVVFVAQWNEAPGDGAEPVGGGGGDTWDVFRSGDGDLTVVANGGGHEQGFLAEDVPHLISIAFDDGVNSVYRIDGVEIFAGDLGLAGQTSTRFFQNAGGGFSLKGYMCEYLAFDHVLTEAELACVEAGLALRWMTLEPGAVCDYLPYCINRNGVDSIDDQILAFSPFAYYKLDDASGNPQDSSGNANHATTIAGTVVYQDTPLSTKAGDSIRLNGATFVIPPPTADPSSPANPWSAIMLAKFTDFDTAVNANKFPGILSWTPAGGSPPKFVWSQFDGNPFLWFDSQFGNFGHVAPAPHDIALGEVHVLAIVAEGASALTGGGRTTMYVDGVVWTSVERFGNGTAGDTFTVGRTADTFFSSADWNVSNLAIFDAALTYDEVLAITEAMLDDGIVATAQVFAP